MSNLEQKLSVSEDTIRRDIKELNDRDLLRAVRGAHSIVQKNIIIVIARKQGWNRKRLLHKKLYH
ncbi:DeoR family transcriptional regulator [Sphingobacterium sp. E70]|uniref:DeoR family transcriptional regulator n=1 Tax=Sphingobacterium sp. E70 TaxID=2853439 RepID=UPI00211CE045|nr:DeoR family transcriptional regulator [Sphingobacterium sp. E70]ULT29204.1 DeoR family transcriptional regulator [Sphingobacterium sp. E70]